MTIKKIKQNTDKIKEYFDNSENKLKNMQEYEKFRFVIKCFDIYMSSKIKLSHINNELDYIKSFENNDIEDINEDDFNLLENKQKTLENKTKLEKSIEEIYKVESIRNAINEAEKYDDSTLDEMIMNVLNYVKN